MKPVSQIWPDDLAARYRAAGHWRGETFGGWLRERAQAHPDKIAIVGGDTRWSYAELDRRANEMAAGLRASGLVAGDRVVVHLPNIPEFFEVVFGLFRAGILPVYALPAHRITEIAHFASSSEASAYVIAGRHEGYDYAELAAELQQRLPAVRQVFVARPDRDGQTGFADLAARGRAQPLPAEAGPKPSDVAFLQISGGSTGLSKLIPRTHDDYIYTLRESDVICGMDAESVFLAALPIAHNYPMSSPGVLGALYAGARVVLSPSPSPEAAFPLIEREGVTMTSLVPPLLLVWLQARPNSQHDLSSLKVMQVGGAKLAPEVARRVRPVLGITLQQVFGMAEGLVNYTRLDDPEEVIVNTQGRPISADDEVLVVDDLGQPVPEGEPGYLLTRGPYTIRGYHNNDSANARSFTEDGFYRTGDIVKRNADGYLSVQGRATDHINRAGEKISAEEIEDHLLAHPNVFDAAVVSIPDEYLGERTCAFIIPQGEKPRGAQIKQWIRDRGLADFKVPDQVVFVDKFAETAALKISRRELRAALRARLTTPEQGEQA
ncbi:(2,3-dihydroxybenzoyl)adenylate synthase [Schauerella aestuarii]|uniref:(2,3-dihydroxybenzoyl)adenylate synthase n=1 Tax=Schauerella aestuarii TaxID=2511204 RepID=UPI00136E0DC0|nr:(2,3-dihydroxybenzoyl)adenylate synthase [Achromobacter aestuarii]MYZ45036.1 (2,3-dihydroxybenzoyl)adenylate synthase [Achromobacter aestuarii]